MLTPELSIIIPTYNRSELLKLVLDDLCLLNANFDSLEVVVVDDLSCDNTLKMLAERNDPYNLRVVCLDKRSGAAVSRNMGVAQANGKILGFLDSDVRVSPEWWNMSAPHFQDLSVAAVEGSTFPCKSSFHLTPFMHSIVNRSGGLYLTCNLFCRSEIFKMVGGFDSRFWSIREDTDFAFSMLEKNHRIIFEPKAVVWHPYIPVSKTFYLTNVRLGFYEALLRRKHPWLYRQKLNWRHGRAIPMFYWAVYLGVMIIIGAGAFDSFILLMFGVKIFGLGWAGSVYMLCRKRRASLKDLFILIPQYLLIPWMRLFWVLKGEWHFRNV